MKAAPVVVEEDSTRVRSSSVDGKAETQPEMQSDLQVQPRLLSLIQHLNVTLIFRLTNKTHLKITAEDVRLRAVPKPDDNTVVNSQSSESQMESASPKNLAIEKAPEAGH